MAGDSHVPARTIPTRRLLAVLTALATAVALLPGAAQAHHKPDHVPPGHDRSPAQRPAEPDAGEPTDYIALADQLSQPVYDEVVTHVFHVELHDGETMHVEVTMPDAEGERFPVILKASPYEGTLLNRTGWRIFPDPRDEDGEPVGLVGYFPPRGYAVAIADLRGTGRSSGCLDHLGPEDAKDLKTVVEWLAAQDWSTGRVGMTGHSYVGSTPSVAAGQNPDGLVTIVPSAGLASMYDHQFQSGVKYFLQWAGTQWAYATISTSRDLPPGVSGPLGETGDNFPSDNPDQTGCGWQTSSLTAGEGQVTGRWQDWHTQRDWREGATAADIPIFMIHGVHDRAARIAAAEWFFGNRFGKPGDKVWLGQFDHGSPGATTCAEADAYGHVNCRFDQWKYALHAWFDHHLKQMDVPTGNPVEVFLNGERVWTAASWEEAETEVALHLDASDMSLRLEPPAEDASEAFTGYATGVGQGSSIEFVSEPFEEETLLVGLPRLRLHASVSTSQSVNLVGVLAREDADGNREEVNYCALNPLLRDSLRAYSPITPGAEMALDLQCFTVAHVVDPGTRLVLSVQTQSWHHVPDQSFDGLITVYTGPSRSVYTAPVRPDAALFDDVERFEGG
jgi:uncharacterized protein